MRRLDDRPGRWMLLSLAVAAGACRTRLLEPPGDGAEPDDLGATCHRGALVPVPLDELAQLNPGLVDGGQQRWGTVVRLLLGFPVGACEAVGPVDVRVMPGNATDFVVVTARVFRAAPPCGPTVTRYRVVYLSADQGVSNPRVVVGDGAPGGTRMLSFDVEPRLPDSCDRAAAINERCTLDCQCAKAHARSRCILAGASSGYCAIPCAQDLECPPGELCGIDDYTCEPLARACTQCELGKECAEGRCRPVPYLPNDPGEIGAPCACSSDCRLGRLCVEGRCVAPCDSHWDCPGPPMATCRNGRCVDK